jgi:hypothetical protein
MKISTGIPIFNTPVDPQGTENQSPNAIFHVGSKSLMSHIIDVSETAIIVKAYGFVNDASTITVCTVTTEKDGLNYAAPMVLNGRHVQLSNRNNVLVIDMTGKYAFQLSDGLGVTTCAYHESGLGLWSFGLSAYAQANGMLEFIETVTVRPQVTENQVREYVKLSADGGNLLTTHADGLYYGIEPPANFQVQYVSSSLGNDNNNGTHDFPLKTIHQAVSNLPDGTRGTIYLYRGDIFSTLIDDNHNHIVADLTTINPATGLAWTFSDLYSFFNGITPPTINAPNGLLRTLYVSNRQITFTPYDDPVAIDVNNYNSAHATYFVPWILREISFPVIKFPIYLAGDNGIYYPASIATGQTGVIYSQACTYRAGKTGTSNPLCSNGCIVLPCTFIMQGGNIQLSGIPMFGQQDGAGTQSVNLQHVQVSTQAGVATPAFQINGIQCNITTIAPYAGGVDVYIPTLPYHTNGDNLETFLTPISFWKNMVIYSANVVGGGGGTVSGSDLHLFKRVNTNIRIA